MTRRTYGDMLPTFQRLDERIVEVRAKAAVERAQRRGRWETSVRASVAAWRERCGYKSAPIMNQYEVKREVHEMLRTVIEGRLMTLLAPSFVHVEAVDRSLRIISMLAAPSGNGPERYAPKPRGTFPQQIKV